LILSPILTLEDSTNLKGLTLTHQPHLQSPAWVPALFSTILGLSLLAGCSDQARNGGLSEGPVALQPEGSRQALGLPADQLPDPINLSDPTTIARRTITPTIIDTLSLPIQRQITGPFDGDVRMIKHELPKHHRDKSLPAGDINNNLSVGEAVAMDRVQTGAGGGTGFEGISQTEWSPPDPTLAVGPDHVVMTVNSAIAFYDKDGNQTFSSALGTPGSPGFFETVGASSNFVFDPKCFYDQKTGRFVVMALEVIGETESWIDIAISDDSDPNGIWYKYRTFSVIDVNSSNYWVDYPGLGSDDNAFYITGNLFLLNGGGSGWGGVLFRIFEKAPMLVGDPVVITDIAPDAGGSVQVAQMFGSAPQPYFVSRLSSTQLSVWTINDPLGSPELRRITVGGMDFADGPSQDAPNPFGGEISTLDGRLMNVHARDGQLYTAHGINGDPGLTVARWYHMDINGWPNSGNFPFLVEQGEVTGDPGQHYFFPAIYSDKYHNVGLVMSRSSASEFASVQVSGRLQSDPAGTMSSPIELAIGDAGANGRWGDYLDIAMDPNDDSTFWIMGMYARNFGWQTWIDSFTLGADCPADLFQDGVLDFFDIGAFLQHFGDENPIVDFTGDGSFDFFDVSAFLTLFSEGCP